MDENSKARTVKDVMDSVDVSAHPDHPLSEALARMRDGGMRILPVVDGDEIVGLLRMRDIERDPDASNPVTAVRDEMYTEILYCFEDDPVEKAIGVMEETGYHEYLVVDSEKRLAGHITLAALKANERPNAPHGSEADAAARRAHGGGRKHGIEPHAAPSFSTRPMIRD